MNVCPRCSSEVNTSAMFCSACGSPLLHQDFREAGRDPQNGESAPAKQEGALQIFDAARKFAATPGSIALVETSEEWMGKVIDRAQVERGPVPTVRILTPFLLATSEIQDARKNYMPEEDVEVPSLSKCVVCIIFYNDEQIDFDNWTVVIEPDYERIRFTSRFTDYTYQGRSGWCHSGMYIYYGTNVYALRRPLTVAVVRGVLPEVRYSFDRFR